MTYRSRHRAPTPAAALLTRIRPAALNEPLYRGSLLLMINTAAQGSLGFIFWAAAARTFPSAEVGILGVVTSAVSLLCAVAAVGIPNLLTRDLATSIDQRGLITKCLSIVASVGMGITAVAVLALATATSTGTQLFAINHGPQVAMVLVLVCSLGGLLDACLIALRAQPTLLVKSVIGGVGKIVALPLLSSQGLHGLVIAYFLGALISAVIGVAGVRRCTTTTRRRRRSRRTNDSNKQARFSAINYLGSILGILPTTVVPVITANALGPSHTAWMSVSMMIAALLNVIPSASSQVLFAEVSRGRAFTTCLIKAARLAFSLLTPAAILLTATAPLILAIFGPDYRANATTPLQLLALSALPAAVNYLCDAAAISCGRTWLYVTLNGANSALVLTLAAVTAPHGTIALAGGWLIAQTLSMIIGGLALTAAGLLRRPPDPPSTTTIRCPNGRVEVLIAS